MALVGKKHSALSTVALPITLNDQTRPKIARLAERMLLTCRKKGGIAIAAPQVGVSERLVVTWDGQVWINPRITIDVEDTEEDLEGCLSIPGRVYRVSRFTSVEMTTGGLDGDEITVDLSGLEARMIQHEIDHLDGVLISERGVEVANVGPSAMKL